MTRRAAGLLPGTLHAVRGVPPDSPPPMSSPLGIVDALTAGYCEDGLIAAVPTWMATAD